VGCPLLTCAQQLLSQDTSAACAVDIPRLVASHSSASPIGCGHGAASGMDTMAKLWITNNRPGSRLQVALPLVFRCSSGVL